MSLEKKSGWKHYYMSHIHTSDCRDPISFSIPEAALRDKTRKGGNFHQFERNLGIYQLKLEQYLVLAMKFSSLSIKQSKINDLTLF